MKINKQVLKKIIKEELENLKENPFTVDDLKTAADTDVNRPGGPGVSTSDVRRDAAATAKQQVAGGITDEERALIRSLVKQLSSGAQKTNLLSGGLTIKIKQLVAALNKVVGDQDGEQK